jgi:hypothetical protein
MVTSLKKNFWKITAAILLAACVTLSFFLIKNSMQKQHHSDDQKYQILKEKFILLAQVQENLYEILLSSQQKMPDASIIGDANNNRAKLIKLQNLLNGVRKNQSDLTLSDMKTAYINIAQEQMRIFQLLISEKVDIDYNFDWDFSNCFKPNYSKIEERKIPEDPFKDTLDNMAKDKYTAERRKKIFYEDIERWMVELNQNVEELQKEK